MMLSIITPVLNGAEFIKDNIESIKKLKIPHEHIIVDGGSKDGTLEIIGLYSHIKLLHQTDNTGMYGAIDLGFKEAMSKYICWVNCDDRVIEDGFTKLVHFADSKNLDFVCSDGIMLFIKEDKKKKVRGTRLSKYFLKYGLFPFIQPSAIFKKELYYKVNGFNYNEFKIIGDGELFFRMSSLDDVKFGYIPVSSCVFIKYGASLGDRNLEIAKIERRKSKIPDESFFRYILLKIIKLIRY